MLSEKNKNLFSRNLDFLQFCFLLAIYVLTNEKVHIFTTIVNKATSNIKSFTNPYWVYNRNTKCNLLQNKTDNERMVISL